MRPGLSGAGISPACGASGTPLPGHVHAPIGLRIGSTTPAEIAVSIAAEMVRVRSAPALT